MLTEKVHQVMLISTQNGRAPDVGMRKPSWHRGPPNLNRTEVTPDTSRLKSLLS